MLYTLVHPYNNILGCNFNKKLKGEHIADLCYWLYFMVVSYIVIALQPDNLPSIVQFSKALYIIPLASTFSLVDKLIGLESETRKF